MAHPLRAFRLRLAALLRGRRQQDDYAEELAFHQHMLREKLLREGTPAAQAAIDARVAFGNPQRWRERLAELRQFRTLENIARDLAYAARVLRKSPGFTLTAILTIALGIGANTAIFSLINGLLLRPLPVPHADQLVVFGYHQNDGGLRGVGAFETFPAPLFRHLEHDHAAFSNVFATSHTQLQIGAGGSALVSGVIVSGSYFDTLQVPPLLGRYLTVADDQPSAGPVAVISERYWKNALHSDPQVIGRKLVANRVLFTIVGVMPKQFTGTDPTQHPQIFLPLATEPLIDAPYNNIANGYRGWWLVTMGRMKPDVTLQQADAALPPITRNVLDGPDADATWAKDARAAHFQFTVQSGSTGYTYLRALYRRPLQAVLALCGALLLLACLNLASLLFARSATRGRELATRLAIGASRRRLVQQLLLESLLLSCAGCIAGIAAAPFVARGLARLLLGGEDPSFYLDTSLDWRVLAICACACALATLLIGVAPSLHATGRTLSAQLKASSIARESARTGLLPRVLLTAQIAIALMLVVGAGLVSSSLVRMYRTGPGFDQHNINLVSLRMTKQPLQGDQLIELYRFLQRRIAALPGVRDASILSVVPFSNDTMTSDYTLPNGRPSPQLYTNWITPEYFRTMRIPLLAGRDFAWSDTAATGRKIILSRSAAAAMFPGEDPLGKQIKADKDTYQVTGIVGDVKYSDIREPAPPEGYMAITQNKESKPSYTFIARVEGPAAPFAAAVRAILTREAPEIPAPVFNTLGGFLNQSLSAERMMALLSVFFAACALLVTAIGLYGTLAYRTARRTSEIGIRIALGAQRTQVVALVFRQNVAVTVLGAAAGLGAALLAARTLASFLYGTSTHDPLVLCGATLLLALVASAASLVPAIRAARINPLTAIRTE